VKLTGSMEGRTFYEGLLEALAGGVGLAKDYLVTHSPRAAVLAYQIGLGLGLSDKELARIFFGAILCDMGMIGLAEEAWENPEPALEPSARAEIRQHPVRSAAGAGAIPFLSGCQELIRHHHEWWDGSGYPDGLSGEAIPLGARIVRLADTVTALGEPRPHREARSPSEIRSTIQLGSGVEFDPHLVDLWLGLEGNAVPLGVPAGHYHEILTRAVTAIIPEVVPIASAGILMELFSSLIDAKDPYTAGHSRRVARLAGSVMGMLGEGQDMELHARAAGHLHDLGKLSVPSRILRKPTGLCSEENLRVRRHAGDGAELLEGIPSLRSFAPACRYHHECWDGSGYPEGLRGEEIPLVARVLGICDAYDAMTSIRAYRNALSHGWAMAEIAAHLGGQFAPVEAEAFLSLPNEVFERLHGDPGNEFDLLAVSLYAGELPADLGPTAAGNGDRQER